jgi:phosphoribosylformylglycinamidine synthase
MIRIKDSSVNLAMSVDGNGRFCELDPFTGAQIAVAEAARNVVCAGATPSAITNCLNFGNPEKPGIMWQFSRAVDGIAKACETFGTPVTGGNVSFYNETEGQAIYPTPVIGMVGIVRNSQPLTPHFKREGDVVLIVGPTATEELGGSRYSTLRGRPLTGPCPGLDLNLEKREQDALLQAAGEELLQSLHDCSDGGLITTVAESSFGAYPMILGCELAWEGPTRADAFLFGEAQSRYLLSCRDESLSRLREILEFHRVPYHVFGKTSGRELSIRINGEILIRLPVRELYDIWYNSLTNQLR